jgi:23S rRNA (guanosine2251-2'-O)-methyltransferase
MSGSLIYGRKPVLEALKAQEPLDEIQIQEHTHGWIVEEIISLARTNHIKINRVSSAKIQKIAGSYNHQGVIARMMAGEFKYSELEDLFIIAEQREEPPFFALLDQITDPHNLGAIIRSAECAGVHGVIIPRHNSAEVNATVIKTSAGATSYCKIVMTTNINQTIDKLKEKGLWIFGTVMENEKNYFELDWTGPTGIVIGGEEKGMRPLVSDHCDFLVKIPMQGRIQSLNASVASGILFFEVRKQRLMKK